MMLLKLNTRKEGREIDDILLLGINREIDDVHEVPKPYIINVGDY
jgi:hypothetical protein